MDPNTTEIVDEMIALLDELIDEDDLNIPAAIRLYELIRIIRITARTDSPRAARPTDLDFASALATGLPMRRARWMLTGPMASSDSELVRIAAASWWIYPVPLRKNGEPMLSSWINLANAERMVLTRDDYSATDWEVIQ